MTVQKETMRESKLAAAGIVIAVGCAWAYILIAGEPRLPIGAANGTYSNRCCGTLTLKNGTMRIGGQKINYVIESNKMGPYVLPNVYVGASPQGFVVRPKGYPLILNLDRPNDPRRVELLDDSVGPVSYTFARTNGS